MKTNSTLLEKKKEEWLKLGYHDSDVPIEYEKFKKEWNAFDKGFRFAKLDGRSFIASALKDCQREERRKVIEEIETNLVNLKGYKMFSFKGVMRLIRDYRRVALNSKSGGRR